MSMDLRVREKSLDRNHPTGLLITIAMARQRECFFNRGEYQMDIPRRTYLVENKIDLITAGAVRAEQTEMQVVLAGARQVP